MANIKTNVRYINVGEGEEDQRIDNFLISELKTIPKSKIYRILRKGEVRVNKKRIDPSYRLRPGDSLRLPPLMIDAEALPAKVGESTMALLKGRILYEDDHLLILNKPSGLPVHVGSTTKVGVIEALRELFSDYPQLELAHRLDAETSGCLILAKKKKILRELHALLREGKVKKQYWALTKGVWLKRECTVDLPLNKHFDVSGKHVVRVEAAGKSAKTIFTPLKTYSNVSLVQASLLTGRTHQIRVHAQSQGHPIAGDDRYGDQDFNKWCKKFGIKRLFLHARKIDFTLPTLKQHIKVVAPLDLELENSLLALANLDKE